MKASFDATFNKSHSKSCSRIVVRDSNCQVLASRSFLHNHVGSAFIAKALSCKEAIRVCVDLKVESVTVEGDSLTN